MTQEGTRGNRNNPEKHHVPELPSQPRGKARYRTHVQVIAEVALLVLDFVDVSEGDTHHIAQPSLAEVLGFSHLPDSLTEAHLQFSLVLAICLESSYDVCSKQSRQCSRT
jgi:hypothetical protein